MNEPARRTIAQRNSKRVFTSAYIAKAKATLPANPFPQQVTNDAALVIGGKTRLRAIRARYVASDYYKGESLVVFKISSPTADTAGLPVATADSAKFLMSEVMGQPMYTADLDIAHSARVLQRERMRSKSAPKCFHALFFACMNGVLFGMDAL